MYKKNIIQIMKALIIFSFEKRLFCYIIIIIFITLGIDRMMIHFPV